LLKFGYDLQIYLHGLVQGNITEDEAKGFYNVLRTKLGTTHGSDAGKMTELRCRELPAGAHVLTADSLNRRDGNTVITNYYQGHYSPNYNN
jgi:hypothetical protein